MSWRYYTSADAGAPVLNGTVGSLITLLDAVLTGPSGTGSGNAYGSKPCAGWSKAFSGTNKAVYKMAAGSTTRFFFRVLDDGSGLVGARDAAIRGFETMSDVDTGTNPFPTTVTHANGLSLGKSTALNSTAVQWFILASGQTFLFGKLVGRWQVEYVGEFDSFTPSDAANACIVAAAAGSTPDGFSASELCKVYQQVPSSSSDWAAENLAIARLSNQGAGGVLGSLMHSSGLFVNPTTISEGQNGWGRLPKVNPADGAAYICPLLVNEHGLPFGTRGKLRGVYAMPHQGTSWADQETFVGAGDLAGRTYLVLRMTPYLTAFGSPTPTNTLVAFEISNTL